MTATETITSNPRVLGADPLVCYEPADGDKPEKAGGIGEEDIVSITLPYIKSAREGVIRLGSLLEQYGTYEMNGIAFQDVDEIWWLETIGDITGSRERFQMTCMLSCQTSSAWMNLTWRMHLGHRTNLCVQRIFRNL